MAVVRHPLDTAIAAFWDWWSRHRDDLAAAIASGAAADWSERLGDQVGRIHRRLDWELGRGRAARHALCVSGMGDPELRLVAEQWRGQAPPADACWEYHPTRIAAADPSGWVLDLGTVRVPFRDLRVAIEVDAARECLHLAVWHPAFGALPEGARRQVAYLVLDNTLGEDGVERWLGVVRLLDACPDDAANLHELRERVDDLAAQATGAVYARLTGTTEQGRPMEVIANLALKRWDHPRFHAHGQIEVPFEPDADGMPSEAESEQLDRLEVGLLSGLGSYAVFAGREQGEGRRVVHLYAAEDGPVPEAVARWARVAPRRVTVRWARDPIWAVWRRW